MLATIPEQYRAMLIFAVGSGLRQGEYFGVTVDRLDFLPLKTMASYRSVPLNADVLDVVADHLHFGAGPDGLVCTDRGKPIRRTSFSAAWRPAAVAAGIPSGGGDGMHGLRRFLPVRAHPPTVAVRKRSKAVSGTPRSPRRWTPTATSGPTPRRARAPPSDSALGGLLRGHAATRGVLTGPRRGPSEHRTWSGAM